jgi:hypothetical protein
LIGCRYNSTASDTTANDQGAVGCDQRGGLDVQDGKAVGPASLTSTGTLFTVADTTGYGSISVQVTSAGVGATITYQASEDGTTWTSVAGWGPGAVSATTPSTQSTSAGLLYFPTTAKQFRAQITAYTSGTVTAQATLRKDPLPKQAMQVGISTSGNNVGGYNQNIANTPIVQNAAYSAGNAIGGLQTFAFFRTSGGTGVLNNVSVASKGGSTTAITLYIFSSNPSGSTCTDKSAFSLAAADVSKLIAQTPVVLTPAVIGSGATVTFASQQAPVSVKNADSTTSLYVCAVVGGSVTPASTTDLVFNLAGLQD